MLILIIALLPGIASAAERSKAVVEPQKPKAPQVGNNPCAQYGAGFVQVQGTNTCIRATGSIRVDVGNSR